MLNKIFLIGNVGRTPDIKMVGDSKVANFSLGVTKRGFTKKDGTKVEEKTDWFNCQAWQTKAEIIEKYVKTGDKLHIEGEMSSRRYEKDGVEKMIWEVRVLEVELLTPKSASSEPATAKSPAAAPSNSASPKYDDLPF